MFRPAPSLGTRGGRPPRVRFGGGTSGRSARRDAPAARVDVDLHGRPFLPDGGPPRVRLAGADLVRAIAVLTVVYSHISFYLIDDLGYGWWGIDLVFELLVRQGGLNQHLSFLGVAIFMTMTGVLVTRSAIRHRPSGFLVARLARLLPAFWIAVAVAVLLVRAGINTMFSGQPGISDGQILLSFTLGNFFLTPEVAALGVTWTLAVQVTFYLYCVVLRPVLQTRPAAVPILGAAVCLLVLQYNLHIPEPYQAPFVSKIVATLPTIFLGQLLYLGWSGLVHWRYVVIGMLLQCQVVVFAVDHQVYWAGSRYLWTIAVVTVFVAIVGKVDGRVARSAVVRWVATRSYAIYLVHTLVLYRVYENTVEVLGRTGAIVAFVIVCALASEALYRWVERPAADAVTGWWSDRQSRAARPSYVPVGGGSMTPIGVRRR